VAAFVGCTLEESGSEGRGFESRRLPAYTNRYTNLGVTGRYAADTFPWRQVTFGLGRGAQI